MCEMLSNASLTSAHVVWQGVLPLLLYPLECEAFPPRMPVALNEGLGWESPNLKVTIVASWEGAVWQPNVYQAFEKKHVNLPIDKQS